MTATEAATHGAPLWRRLLDIAAVGPSTARGPLARIVFAGLVCIGAVPYLGWAFPCAWMATVAALVAAEHRAAAAHRSLFSWLISAAYAAAAFYLTLVETGAAQTLGVTLFGVAMFKILARDYPRRRRLLSNLSPLLVAMGLVQLAACVYMLQRGEPWQIVTVLATAGLVFRAFRAVQIDLNQARARLGEASLKAQADARALREAHRVAEMAETIAGVGHWRVDIATGVTTWSEGVYRIYGLKPGTPVPTLEEQLALYDDDHRDDLLARLRRAAVDGQPFELEGRMTRADGSRRHVVCHGAAELGADGAVEIVFGAFMDVTEARTREATLLDAKLRAEAAADAKAEFLANMSHEIRTPLTAINGFSNLLAGVDGLPPEATGYVRRVNTAGLALMSVVNDILDFSRLEAGQVVLDPRPFAPAPFFEDLTALFAEQAEAKDVELHLDLAADLPAALETDANRLRQVVVNLIGNAVKFTDQGEVRVGVGWAGGELSVSVADTGCGVPEDKREVLFQRFSQVDGSHSRRHGGTGLGLSICKGLVELLGGTIGMVPAPGGGSVFGFRVPAQAATLETAAPQAVAEAGETQAARILVVDDLDVNRELVRKMLQAIGHEVIEADSGAEAVRLAAGQPLDLILMDLQMPGMDGFASARAIRGPAGGSNRDTPIIALSADVLPEHIDASTDAGMNGHIGKPISPVELIGAVGQWAGVRVAA